MTADEAHNRLAEDLRSLGIEAGDTIMVHSSLKSLGSLPGGPETVVRGLQLAVGSDGTLLMPALSYMQKPPDLHDTRLTPSNVGAIPEHFRTRPGTARSVHPTHSVCGVGPQVARLFARHHLDNTPCGPNSPFNRMIDLGAKIVMLGCGLRPNTTMHALEEYVVPPYLFDEARTYTITDGNAKTYAKTYVPHFFKGWKQRYDRIAELPCNDLIRSDKVLAAVTHVIDSVSLKEAVLERMREAPLYFVDPESTGPASDR
jgi:aminoglycoside 3-N-acetyltransferase